MNSNKDYTFHGLLTLSHTDWSTANPSEVGFEDYEYSVELLKKSKTQKIEVNNLARNKKYHIFIEDKKNFVTTRHEVAELIDEYGW